MTYMSYDVMSSVPTDRCFLQASEKMVVLPAGPAATLLTSQAHVDRSSYGGGGQTMLALVLG